MRSSQTTNLPESGREYNAGNEQITRRSIEQALSDLRNDVVESQNLLNSVCSLSQRRFQFLLMGA